MLQWREMAGKQLKVTDLQETFKTTIQIWEKHQELKEKRSGRPEELGLGYDPSLHSHKDVLVSPRAAYTTELLRQVAHVSGRVVAVVDEAMLAHIEDKWTKLPRQLQALESFYHVSKEKKSLDQQETWLEFIEK